MPTVGIRELARNASKIIRNIQKDERPVVVTLHGRPVAAVVPIDPDALEDFIMANAPEFARSMREADRDLETGKTRPAADVFAEMEDGPGAH